MNSVEIGKRIKEKRKALRITQKELSAMTGIAEITLRQYEAGKYSPKIETRIKLANALKCSYIDLFEEDAKPEGFETGEEFDAWREDVLRKARETGAPSIEARHHADGTVTNKLHTRRPEVDLSDLTDNEICELQNYRDYLLFKRNQSPQKAPQTQD